jgi:D-hydroxyproline dehydrogenase subunit gamma
MNAPAIMTGVVRKAPVTFRFNGVDVNGVQGETIASALLGAGIRCLRSAPVDGGERGMFCAMGICQECLVEVDGQRVEACRTPVRAGLEVREIRYGDV